MIDHPPMSTGRYRFTTYTAQQDQDDWGTMLGLAYSIAGAAEATATTEAIIKDAIRAGALRMRRAGLETEVIVYSDLKTWCESLPDYY